MVGLQEHKAADPAITRSRALRRNMTEGEQLLWSELRQWKKHYGLHVRRQAPIGNYIVDFAIHSQKLVIEIDGEHHFTERGILRDQKRDQWLNNQGYQVIRINTGELSENFDGCIETILHELGMMN